MTFQVRVKCLICRKLTDPTEKPADAEALKVLHKKLCAALKLELSPEFREWDFADEPFPYCETCGQRLQRLGELIDQLKTIYEEIDGSLATVSALIITSEKSDTISDDSDPLIITPTLGQAEDHFRSQRLQAKHNYFRKSIIRRFDPVVNVERCDVSCNYGGLSDEVYHFELVPRNNTVMKTEPVVIQPFPFQNATNGDAEGAVYEEDEYKVDTSTNFNSIVEQPETIIRMDGTWPSFTGAPALSLASNPVQNPSITVVTRSKDPGRSTDSMQFDVTFDAASQAYELKGFKFKELKTGSYECSTCGQVSTKPKGGQRSNSKYNMIRHIKAMHMGIPRFPPSNKGEPSATTFYYSSTIAKDQGSKKSIPPQEYILKFDQPTKTYDLNGFKYKQVADGYECLTCGRVLTNPNTGRYYKMTYIRRHIKTVHMGVQLCRNPKRHQSVCDKCDKVFASSQSLYQHRKRVHGSRQFKCNTCGAKFWFNWQLKQHAAEHSRNIKPVEKPYSCSECAQSFVDKIQLESHAQEHSRERAESDVIKVEASADFISELEPETIVGLDEAWNLLSEQPT